MCVWTKQEQRCTVSLLAACSFLGLNKKQVMTTCDQNGSSAPRAGKGITWITRTYYTTWIWLASSSGWPLLVATCQINKLFVSRTTRTNLSLPSLSPWCLFVFACLLSAVTSMCPVPQYGTAILRCGHTEASRWELWRHDNLFIYSLVSRRFDPAIFSLGRGSRGLYTLGEVHHHTGTSTALKFAKLPLNAPMICLASSYSS
jgi:hypothetical protein